MDQFIGDPLQWNQGIGTQLVLAVKDWLFEHTNADRVVMEHRVGNKRAIHVYETCGFRKVKRLPGHELHEGAWHDCWLMEAKRDRHRSLPESN